MWLHMQKGAPPGHGTERHCQASSSCTIQCQRLTFEIRAPGWSLGRNLLWLQTLALRSPHTMDREGGPPLRPQPHRPGPGGSCQCDLNYLLRPHLHHTVSLESGLQPKFGGTVPSGAVPLACPALTLPAGSMSPLHTDTHLSCPPSGKVFSVLAQGDWTQEHMDRKPWGDRLGGHLTLSKGGHSPSHSLTCPWSPCAQEE